VAGGGVAERGLGGVVLRAEPLDALDEVVHLTLGHLVRVRVCG